MSKPAQQLKLWAYVEGQRLGVLLLSGYMGTASVNRQHLWLDPFTINTPCPSHSLLVSEKNIKRWPESLLVVRGLELNLRCRKEEPSHSPWERNVVQSWHCNTATLSSPGEKWTTGNPSYYYYLVCNFRLHLTGEWQAEWTNVSSKNKCST